MRYGLIIAAVALAGCETSGTAPLIEDPPSAPSAAPATATPGNVSWAKRKGTARVDGKLVLSTQSFGSRPGSGQNVFIVPQDRTTDAAMTEHFGRSGYSTAEFPWSKLPGEVRSARRQTRANSAGNFSFRSVPAGKWIAVGCVRWQTPGAYVPEGGCMIERFQVATGQRLRLQLAQ